MPLLNTHTVNALPAIGSRHRSWHSCYELPFPETSIKNKRQEITQSTNSHQYSSCYQATHSHSHPAHSYSQLLAQSKSAGHSSSMTSVKTNGGPDISISIQSIPTFEKSSVSNAVIFIATVKNFEEPGTFETVLNSISTANGLPQSKWVMLLHPRSIPTYPNWQHVFKYSVYLHPIVAWQTVNCLPRRWLSFQSNCLQEKTNQKTNKKKYIRFT